MIDSELQTYFPFWEPVKRGTNCLRDESIVYNSLYTILRFIDLDPAAVLVPVAFFFYILFTIAYIQYKIGLQLYLLKRHIDKVTESGFQAIKVSVDVEK